MSGEAELMAIPLREQIAQFQAADITWIAPESYYRNYHHLMEEDMFEQAVFTKPDGVNPDYVNIQYNAAGQIMLTVRGDPNQNSAPDGTHPVAMIIMDLDDWDQLIASTRMLRRPDPAQPEFPVEGELQTNDPGLGNDWFGDQDRLRAAAEGTDADANADPAAPLRDDDLAGSGAKFFDPLPEGTDPTGGARAGDPLGQRTPGTA